MPKTNPKSDKDDQPNPSPSNIPILPNNEVDPILPEPIKAPPESDDEQPPDSINENPNAPPIYV